MRTGAAATLFLLAACQSPDTTSDAGQAAGDAAIGFYQRHIGHQWGYHCDFEPSCSTYGRTAVNDYGLLPGVLMIFDRLQRDHPLAPGQYQKTPDGRILDPVASNARFESRWVAAMPVTPQEQLTEAEQARPGTDRQQFEFAVKLFDEQDWERASVELRRSVYLFPDGPDRMPVLRRLAICLSRLGRHGEAMDAARQLPLAERNTLLAYLMREAGRLDEALVLSDQDDSEAQLLRGMISLEAENYEAARISFRALEEPPREYLLHRVDGMQSRPTRSPALAGSMSALLPGSGQMYAGRTSDGWVAFLTNATLIGGTWAAVHNDEEVTAAVVGFVALAFYTGNVYGGINAAHRYNETSRDQWLQETRGHLRQNASGFGLVPLPDGAALGWYLQF